MVGSTFTNKHALLKIFGNKTRDFLIIVIMALETQLQIRQNATEVQEYLKDLFDWESNVKKKDQAIQGSRQQSGSEGSTIAPAPRGRAVTGTISAPPAELQQPGLTHTGKRAKAPSKVQPKQPHGKSSVEGTAASHTYASYSKWDKLDVDKLLESDEEEAEAEPTSSLQAVVPQQGPTGAKPSIVPAPRKPTEVAQATEYAATAAPMQAHVPAADSSIQQHPPVRNSEPQTADAWRARGNELFKAGQHTYAKECYARCISLDPDNAVAYANKAMAELKLQEWIQAEQDCTKALQLDPTYVKVCTHDAQAVHGPSEA